MHKKFSQGWNSTQDFLVVWILPIASILTAISGVLFSVNVINLKINYPHWSGLIDLVHDNLFLFFLIVALLMLSLNVLSTFRAGTIKGLTKELKAHRSEINEVGDSITYIFDGLLLNLSKKLKFAQDTQARLSLYIHDSERNIFIPCGRYSPNPTFNTPGRTAYPANEGCIAEGWSKSWHFDMNIPTAGAARRSHFAKKIQYAT